MRSHRRSEPQRRERCGGRPTMVDCYPSAPRTKPFLATRCVHSSQPSPCCVVPFPAKADWIDVRRRIQGSDSIAVELHQLASVFGAKIGLDVFANRCLDLLDVIFHEGIGQAHPDTLFSAMNGPDECPVRGIEFVDTRFLLDDFSAIETESRLAGHHNIARYSGGKGHAPEAAHRTGNQSDHWSMRA